MSPRKEELQEAALNYLLERGVAKLSLRPLAAQLGTSPRVLMFHFKSKEGLLQDVLGELNARLQASLAAMASESSGPSRDALLKRFWRWATSKRNVRYLRLLYEVQILAIQNPAEYARYLNKMSVDWQTLVLQTLSESVRTEPMATLCIAVFDGLFLELMSTGDHPRLTRALDQFVSLAKRQMSGSAGRRVAGSKGRRIEGSRIVRAG